MVAVAVLGAKGAPGATVSAVALALRWPRPVLLADADLAGGDIGPGWLAGRVGAERGLLSFAATTRNAEVGAVTGAELAAHVTGVPDAPGVMVLPGLVHAGQAGGLTGQVWARLASAAATGWPAEGGTGLVRVDLLADCGRVSDRTPWQLVAACDVVLLATRPTLRGVHHARHAVAGVQAMVGDPSRVGLLVCGPGPYPPVEVGRVLGLPVRVALPADPGVAAALADGGELGRGWTRTMLARAAGSAARLLVAASPAPPAGSPSAAGVRWSTDASASGGGGRQ